MTDTAPIFVIGTPRSGTTLTANMLNRHSAVMMPGENHFFEDIYSRRGELGTLANPQVRERVVDRMISIYARYNQTTDAERIKEEFGAANTRSLHDHADSYEQLLHEFMNIRLSFSGKRRWGNNTPKDIFHVRDIMGVFPDVVFVVCIRDLRDFLLSYKGRWKVTTQAHKERLRNLYHPVITTLLWKATVRKIMTLAADAGGDRYIVLRYEDLVRDPEGSARRICTLIGEAYEPDMCQVDENNSSDAASKQGIYTSSIGRWESGLSAEEIFIAQSLAGVEMAFLGYEAKAVQPNLFKLLLVAAGLPIAAWRALYANRANRGPTLRYLAKRLGLLVKRRGDDQPHA